MKQTLLLMMLALGLCSISMSAQTKKPVKRTVTQVRKNTSTTRPVQKNSREYKVEDDGFEWYLVCKNGKYGAESREGKMLVPTEYEKLWYNSLTGFHSFTYYDGYVSLYNKEGKCIIPYTRHYTGAIVKMEDEDFGYYYAVTKGNAEVGVITNAICDSSGKEVIYLPDAINIDPYINEGIFYFRYKVNHGNEGIADANGKIIVQPRKEHVSLDKNGNFYYREEWSENGFLYGKNVVVASTSSMSTTQNPFAGNVHDDSKTNYSNSNSGNKTTTVVVEHHRNLVPVQEWQQCPACYGSGQCPYVKCGGSGWYYIGDKATTCSMCHGSGKCTTCAGKGGQYITVYR